MCEKCNKIDNNICNCDCKNYKIIYNVWVKKWNCKKCKCEINNILIEKICVNCKKPVTKCSYTRNDNEIIPEHKIEYFITVCFNNGEKHYCCRTCAISDLEIFDSKIIGKIEKSD